MKPLAQTLQPVRQTLEEFKLVSYLPYNFYKNVMLDLLNVMNTFKTEKYILQKLSLTYQRSIYFGP